MRVDAGTKIIGVLLVIFVIIFAPLFTIAALNTLFEMNIDYTFFTWLSALWINTLAGLGISTGD
jgi:uncharacterized membrane protein